MNILGKFEDFFGNYLCFERGVADNTLRSYATTLKLFTTYIRKKKKITGEKITFDMINRINVLSFLRHLSEEEHASDSTCNQRLAALKAFAKYMITEDITHAKQWGEILKIAKKRTQKHIPEYLSIDGMSLLLNVIPQTTRKGRRDLTLLALMYETGARVQEIIDLTPTSLHISSKPYEIKIHGKGNKTRMCQLSDVPRDMLIRYMEENGLNLAKNNYKPLFQNNRGSKLTESGIAFIIRSYATMAREQNENLMPIKITPHAIRHTRAMHLLSKGMELIYIRDILGHVSVQTTEIYARIDSKGKQEALKKAHTDVIPQIDIQPAEEDDKISAYLSSIGK